MKLSFVLTCTTAAAFLLVASHVPAVSSDHVTRIIEDTIPVNSPVVWFPMVDDVVIGFYTNVVNNLVRIYGAAKENLEHEKEMLSRIPPFYGSIGLFYDGDHLRPMLDRRGDWLNNARKVNLTAVPKPKMAFEVVDTVKMLMQNLNKAKH